jgi:hypothetical protein
LATIADIYEAARDRSRRAKSTEVKRVPREPQRVMGCGFYELTAAVVALSEIAHSQGDGHERAPSSGTVSSRTCDLYFDHWRGHDPQRTLGNCVSLRRDVCSAFKPRSMYPRAAQAAQPERCRPGFVLRIQSPVRSATCLRACLRRRDFHRLVCVIHRLSV